MYKTAKLLVPALVAVTALAISCGDAPELASLLEPGADSFFEEFLIRLDPVGRKDPNVDLRLGIVESHSQQALPVILDLHDVAVVCRLRQAQDGAVVNPGMSGKHAISFTWFQQHSGEGIHNEFVNSQPGIGKRRVR